MYSLAHTLLLNVFSDIYILFLYMKNCVFTDFNIKRIMLNHFYSKIGKKACTIFSCILGHTEEIKMAAALLTAALKTFDRS